MFGYLVTSLSSGYKRCCTHSAFSCAVLVPPVVLGCFNMDSIIQMGCCFCFSVLILYLFYQSCQRDQTECIKRRCVPFSRANEHKPAWQTQKQSLTNTKQTTRCVPIFSIFKLSLFVYGLLYNSLMYFYLRKLLMILRFPSEVLLYMANLTRNK